VESHGALVGWMHQDLGDRILLRLESMPSTAALDAKDPDLSRLLMSKQQAFVLGSYLIQASGQSAIDPNDRSWFRRLFG
jgi:hypothetical protein